MIIGVHECACWGQSKWPEEVAHAKMMNTENPSCAAFSAMRPMADGRKQEAARGEEAQRTPEGQPLV